MDAINDAKDMMKAALARQDEIRNQVRGHITFRGDGYEVGCAIDLNLPAEILAAFIEKLLITKHLILERQANFDADLVLRGMKARKKGGK